ncbi:MAG: YafY family transcriptional regulator [Bacteroidetes bacterium]|nr:YafY family transcriptional regulator [Bacteroidota bacterium]
MNRTDRLFALLLEIQSTPRITAARLAERFDVTKRTIYRDVLALMEANVPVNGKAGEGYSIAEGYFLPPVSFTQDEALMLILGAGAMGQHFDAQYRSAARSAGAKIRSTLPPRVRKEVDHLRDSIAFYAQPPSGRPDPADALPKIRRAILERKRIAFRYYKRTAVTPEPMVREVDPYALLNFHGNWTMIGHDHLRRDLRMFRLDRMEAVLVTAKTFERPRSFSLTGRNPEETDTRRSFRIRIDRAIHRWVKEQPPYTVVKTEVRKDSVYLTVRTAQQEQLFAWLLRWGGQAEAVAPPEFRSAFLAHLRSILSRYGG